MTPAAARALNDKVFRHVTPPPAVEQNRQEVIKRENDNIILVPLNTKLSTISVAIVALRNEKVQVVYPVPEVYNINYSEPSNNATVIDVLKILNQY